MTEEQLVKFLRERLSIRIEHSASWNQLTTVVGLYINADGGGDFMDVVKVSEYSDTVNLDD